MCACLGLLIIIVLIVSLPSIVSNGIFGLDGVQPIDGATLLSTYNEMAEVVDQAVDDGYNQALAQLGMMSATFWRHTQPPWSKKTPARLA